MYSVMNMQHLFDNLRVLTTVHVMVILQVLMKVMPLGVFRGYSAVIRGLNNIVGGISFVTIARMFGVQKAGTAASPVLQES